MKNTLSVKVLGVAIALFSSTILADVSPVTEYTTNMIRSPFNLRLDVGSAIPASRIKSRIIDHKIKQKAALNIGLSANYQITDEFSVFGELGLIPRMHGDTLKISELRAQPNNFVAKELMYQQTLYMGVGGISTYQLDNLIGNKLDGDNDAIMKDVPAVAAYNRLYEPTITTDNIKDFLNKAMPYLKNQVTTRIAENIRTTTLMLGGEFKVLNKDQFKLFLGASGGIASHRYKSTTQVEIKWDYPKGTSSTLRFIDNHTNTGLAYGGSIRASYKPVENIDISLSYGYKDLGKVERANTYLRNTKKSIRSKQRVHLVNAGISFNF